MAEREGRSRRVRVCEGRARQRKVGEAWWSRTLWVLQGGSRARWDQICTNREDWFESHEAIGYVAVEAALFHER